MFNKGGGVKKRKTLYRRLLDEFQEGIYFALNNWDMNIMTKHFAKELARELASRAERIFKWKKN